MKLKLGSLLLLCLISFGSFANSPSTVHALVSDIVENELRPSLKRADKQSFIPAIAVIGSNAEMLFKSGDENIPLAWASAMKLILSVLVMSAVHDKMIANLDEPVALSTHFDFNDKDKEVTWRQLMSMTSCFDDVCLPGTRFSYSDRATSLFAASLISLYQVTNMEEAINKSRLSKMGLHSRVILEWKNSLATVDFAKIGYMLANDGRFQNKNIIDKHIIHDALEQIVPGTLPISESANITEFSSNYLNLHRFGGGNNQTQQSGDGPGKYVINSWKINTNSEQKCYAANGNWGRAIMVFCKEPKLAIATQVIDYMPISSQKDHHSDNGVLIESIKQIIEKTRPLLN